MRICVSALSAIFVALLVASPTFGEVQELLDFEIKDQFENVHRGSDVAGSIVVLIGADRAGSQFTQAWSKAVRDALSGHPRYVEIAHLAHADLRGAPFFIKGFLRGKFPQDPDRWTLMDWKGVIPKAYDFASKSANVLVFAPDGALVHHASGREPDDEAVRGLVMALRELLDESR